MSPSARTARSRTEISLGARTHNTHSLSTTPVKRSALEPTSSPSRVTDAAADAQDTTNVGETELPDTQQQPADPALDTGPLHR
jgi:hypothetical protein